MADTGLSSDSFHRPTVIVTGGAGYIGSHVIRSLKDANHRPVVLDNFSTGHRQAIPHDIPIVDADIKDRKALEQAFIRHKPSAVFHLAGKTDSADSLIEPHSYYDTNVLGTLNLLQCCRDFGIKKFVFSSSGAIYGNGHQGPISEEAEFAPITPYAQSKAFIEGVLRDYERAYGIHSISLRFFNACGAHEEDLVGEAHPVRTHLIERALLAHLGRCSPLKIFGSDYPTPDGTAIRDYVHVTDLAQAHILALSALNRGRVSPAYNVGLGRGFSVKEVLNTVEDVTGFKTTWKYQPRRPGDPHTLIANSKLIQRELGWQPRYSTLTHMIATAWNWHKQRPDGYTTRPHVLAHNMPTHQRQNFHTN